MTTRLFAWRDLAAFQSTRDQGIFLNSALLLTRGQPTMPGALLSTFVPSMGVVTCVADGREAGEPPVIGQFVHLAGSSFAHLVFLSPVNAIETSPFLELLDFLAVQAGTRGALRLLAEVDEISDMFEAMRRNGYAIFSRQRIWQLTGLPERKDNPNQWRSTKSRDAIAIRALYNNIVPGLVHQMEPFDTQRLQGLVHVQDGEVVAYVELKYGPRGIWVQPFIHPDAEDVLEYFVNLIQKIPSRYSRPVYICIRSYQSWLEPAIQEAGAEAGPRQAVMVKHLASLQKVQRMLALPALESSQPEITAPIANAEFNQTDHGTA